MCTPILLGGLQIRHIIKLCANCGGVQFFLILLKLTLQVEDIEGYPRFICNLCSNILDSAYTLIKKYKDTCKILHSGIDVVKQETEITIENENAFIEGEIAIEPHNIKNELAEAFSDNDNDGFSDEDHEFLVPLAPVKVKLKQENKSKAVKKKSEISTKSKNSTNTKQVTNKIASSILEGRFEWNGNKWW